MWKRDHPLSREANAFNAKLAPKYNGPLTVRRKLSRINDEEPVIVDLKDDGGKLHRNIHIQDLKPAPRESDEATRSGSESEADGPATI